MLFAASIAAIALTSAVVPQEPLAEGVTTFLGGGDDAAWFEKAGTVWVTDGTTHGTRSTGLTPGQYSTSGDRLIVYYPARAEWLFPDGSSQRCLFPFASDGAFTGRPRPSIWRGVRSTGRDHVIEVAEHDGVSWRVRTVGAQVGLEGQYLNAAWPTDRRYYVDYEDFGVTVVTELLSGWTQHMSSTGWLNGSAGSGAWRDGDWFSGEGPGYDILEWYAHDGPTGGVSLPETWGWAAFRWRVREITPACPFIDWLDGAELVTFPTQSTGAFPDPPGVLLNLFWTLPNEAVMAHVDVQGQKQVVQLDRTAGTWSGVTELGAPDLVKFFRFEGRDYLIAESSSGASIFEHDGVSGSWVLFASGPQTIEPGFAKLGDVLVFAADDGVHGEELWVTDGTPAGTRMQAELMPGPAGSQPRDLHRMGPNVVFVANGPGGPTLWSIDPLDLDWKRNPTSGRFYRLTSAAGWEGARRAAQLLGGDLATIRDQSEQDWLWSTFGPQHLWIGLEDRDRDGTFTWVSGEPVTFTSWCAGQPGSPTSTESVVHLANYPGWCQGGWNDQDPLDSFRGIVERGTSPSAVESIGVGCNDAAARWISGQPVSGGAVEIELIYGWPSPGRRGLILLGLDATRIGSLPLPIDLGPVLGIRELDGCQLRLAPLDVLDRGEVLWSERFTFRIPAVWAAGTEVYLQGLSIGGWQMQPNALTDGLRVRVVR